MKVLSSILDEWTNVLQRKFLNICLHGNESSYTLGLIPIRGRFNADIIRMLVEKRVEDFQFVF